MVFWGRWITMKAGLPIDWRPESQVKMTMRILEKPEQTDSKTIIKRGIWRIENKGYRKYVLGERYGFVGQVEAERWGGKIVTVKMTEPKVVELGKGKLRVGERIVIGITRMREQMVNNLSRWLPEPEASLAGGVLLGVHKRMPFEFYQALIKTGTVHIVAASGYNVTIVARVVMVPLLKLFERRWAIVAGVGAIVLYIIVAGGSAAVVRAGAMAGLTLLAYYWGRPAEAKRLLLVTVGIMLIVNPLMLVDVGFQLSVAATIGLLYLEPTIRNGILRGKRTVGWFRKYLADYLSPTLAANISTLPIILWTFGRISLISPLVNMLILPLTPLIMFLSAVVVGGGWINGGLGRMLALILYVPLWMMVEVIRVMGK